MQELVTIVIGIYNVENFLPAGLACVRQQSYPWLDIILVDDGSTDRSGHICDEIAREDSRIRVMHKENGGLGSARNLGLEQARGTYLTFFDVDDSVGPDWVAENVKLMEETGAEMVMHGFTVSDSSGNMLDTIRFPSLHLRSNRELKEQFAELFVFVRHGNGFSWNKFFRKAFLDACNAKFGPETIRQDELFNLRLYPRMSNAVVSDRTPYHYVIYNTGNAASRYVRDKFEVCRSIYLGFEMFCRQWGLDSPLLSRFNANRHLSNIVEIISLNLLHDACPLCWSERRAAALSMMRDVNTGDCLKATIDLKQGLEAWFYRLCLQYRLATAMLLVCNLKKMLKILLKK